MTQSKLGFIGTGKITTAMVEAFARIDQQPNEIWLSPKNRERARNLAIKYSFCKVGGSNKEIVEKSEVIFIAIRPPMAEEVLAPLSSVAEKWVYSMVPTLSVEVLRRLLPGALGYARITPLVTISSFSSPILFYSDSTSEMLPLIQQIGEPVLMKSEMEHQALWVVTGMISPYYEILNTLKGWASEQGVSEETAGRYISEMSQSLSELARNGDFATMAEEAATPGGMNEQSMRYLRENGEFKQFFESLEQIKSRFGL